MGLKDRYAMTQRQLLHGRRLCLLAAPLRAVGLGDHRHHLLAPVEKHLQGGAGELRGAHEDDAQIAHQLRSWSYSWVLRYLRRKISRLSGEMWSTKRMPSRWSISCWKAMARSPSAFQVTSSPSRLSPLTTTRLWRRTLAAYLGTDRHPSSSYDSPSAWTITGLTATISSGTSSAPV